jgi:diguanylate cyclase (GGDEF)-like protein/PAS domain S-box-containing protein
VTVAAGYFVLAHLSSLLDFGRVGISPAWLPAGLALAVVLLRGPAMLAGVAAGSLADQLARSTPLPVALGIALAVTFAAAAGAAVLRRLPQFDPALERPRQVVLLIAVGATVAPLLAAAGGLLALTGAGMVPSGDAFATFALRATGDALGVLLLGTLLLAWSERGAASRLGAAASWKLLLPLCALHALTCATVFIFPSGALGSTAAALVTLPLAAILSTLLPLRWVAVANCLLFVLSGAATLSGTGAFTGDSMGQNFAGLAVYNLVVCTTTLVIAALALERQRAAEQLSGSLERFRSLTALTADWYWEQDEGLRFSYFSSGVPERAGVDPYVSIGKTRFEIPFEWETEEARRRHEQDLEARRPFRNLRLRRAADDGSMRHFSISGEPVFDRSGRFRGYRGVGSDVTEETRAQEALRESEARLRGLVAMSADWMWEQDAGLRYTYFSSGVPQKAGVEPSDSLGKTRFEVPFEWESEQAKRRHEQDLAARRSFRDLKLKRVDDDGKVRYTSVSGEPIFGSDGRFRGYRGVAHDTTAMTLAAEAVRASEMRFRSLVKLSNDWFWEQDEELRFTRMEGSADHGRVPRFQSFIGKQRWDYPWVNMTAADWEAHRELLREQRSFRDLELVGRDESGQLFHILVSGEPVFDAAQRFRGYRGTTRDVTGARKSEQKARRLSGLYATLSEANNAIIHTRDADSLYREICNLAIEHGHFVFCCISAIDSGTGAIRTVAQAGDDRAGLARLPVSLDPALPEGRGPASDAVRSGIPAIVNEVPSNARAAPWQKALRASSVRAFATFPLRRADRIVGALHFYASQPGFFDDDLVSLLGKLALNISFALDNFSREAARRAAEAALQASEARFRDFTESAAEYVWETDAGGRITFISSQVETVSGYTAEAVFGRRAPEFMPPGEAERVREWLGNNRRPDGSFRDLEYRVVSRTGETRWLRQNGTPILDENGERIGWRGTGADITDRRAADERITYLATRDPLTELPNRVLLGDRLVQAIAGARRGSRALAVMFVDLDRFKNINDSLGHEIGDLVLKGASARLVGCVRQGDTLARLGGDEFVLVLEGLRHAEDAAQVAAKVLEALSHPFEVVGHTLITSCSIGISIFPNDADDERTLMKNADIAMYHAKERGRGNYQFFSPDMNTRAVERLNLETALRVALEREEFLLHYQPQLDIRSGRIVGVEALIRWQHPGWGLLAPNKFVPVAEETGLIERLGEWTLLSACRQVRAWQTEGLPPLKIAINISARQLLRPAEFCRKVIDVIELAGIDPSLVELEMTESLLLQNADENISVLNELGRRQIRIAVDDFGTGYSSLSYLKQLPIDTLKIDRSFTRNLPDDHEGTVIVRAIVAMAHSLGLRVTAEGVETKEQLALLRKMRCDEYQGFLFSKPLPAEEMAALLRSQPAPLRAVRRRGA